MIGGNGGDGSSTGGRGSGTTVIGGNGGDGSSAGGRPGGGGSSGSGTTVIGGPRAATGDRGNPERHEAGHERSGAPVRRD